MNKNKIVVFGATGNLGAYTSIHLKNLGYEVIATGFRNSDNGFFEEHGISYYSVDITKKISLEALPQDIYGVVHLAGELPSRYSYDPSRLLETITMGTLNVLDYLVRAGGKKIVFPQTPYDAVAYHNKNSPIPNDFPRTFPMTGDHSVYTIAKNAAVDLIEHYAATYHLNYYVLRFFTIYHYHPNAYHYANYKRQKMPYRMLMDRAMAGEQIEVWGNPSGKKEMVYVKDFTQVVEKCLESPLKGGIYNIGGIAVSLEEQIQGIIDVFSPKDKPSEKVYRPEKPDPLITKFDTSKIENELGYKQKYSYLDSLVDFKKEMEVEFFAKLWGVKEDYND